MAIKGTDGCKVQLLHRDGIQVRSVWQHDIYLNYIEFGYKIININLYNCIYEIYIIVFVIICIHSV
jgi:hypothetical protein